MSQIANNQAVWRVLLNGFPYKSAQEMGLDNDYQAFAVTKQAVYSVLDGRDTNRYFGATEVGNRMANKIRELAAIGRNGTQTYTDPVISATANSQAGVDNIDSKYVSQTFSVNSSVIVPRVNIRNDINVQFSITGQCETYPILFRKSTKCKLTKLCINN